MFNNQFSYSRNFEKITNDIYKVTQGTDEPFKDYVNRFRKKVLDNPHLDIETALKSFKMGLKRDFPFYEDLIMTPCKKLEEFINRSLRFIRLDEFLKIQKSTNTSYNHPNRKNESSSQKPIVLNLT